MVLRAVTEDRAMPESHPIRPAPACGLLLGLLLGCVSPMSSGQSGSEPPPPDPARGRQLYENHCLQCHTSQVHIRERRKGRDPQSVKHQIYRWRSHLELDWGTQEVEDVYTYLQQRFYHFESAGGE